MLKKFLHSGRMRHGMLLLIATLSCLVSFSQNIFLSTNVPAFPLYNAGTPIEVGVKFRTTQAGFITGIRFYKGTGNTGAHIGHLWNRTGTKLAEASFTNETASGWQQVNFTTPVAIAANATYVASYFSSLGNVALSYPYFTSAHINGALRALADGEDGGNGVYAAANSSAFPNATILSANFWVDVVFSASAGTGTGTGSNVDVTPPAVTSVSPGNLSISLNAGTTVSATFSEPMNAATISSSTFELRNALTNAVVPAAIVYNSSSKTVTLYPNSTLNSLLYTATIKGGSAGVKDTTGNAMVNNYSWSFIMIPLIDLTSPTVLSVSPANNATGVATNSAISALFSEEMSASTVNASRFTLTNAANVAVPFTVSYNAGTRTATLTPSVVLATSTVYKVTIKGGSAGVKDASGNDMDANYTWSFTTVTSDVTPPVVTSVSPLNGSVNVTTSSALSAVFSEAMNASTINSSTIELRNSSNTLVAAAITYNATTRTITLQPSSALAGSTVYTAKIKGGASGVKDAAGNPLATDYTWSFTTADITPPTITAVLPANGTTGVSIGTTISATFSEAMNAATVSSSTIELRNASNALITTSIIYDATAHAAIITPSSALTGSTLYKVTVKGSAAGVKDVAGNALVSDYTWSFTTIANTTPPVSVFPPTVVPEHPFIIDQSIEAGMKFQSSQSGYIKGIRYYKGEGTTGTHVGHIWSRNGDKLGEATFINETASGWQEVLFATPVPINAGTVYIASYFSPNGIYGYTNNYFTSAIVNGPLTILADGQDGGNGVYTYTPTSAFPTSSFEASNYFADILFTAGADVAPPGISSVSPVNGATNVATNTAPAAIFNEAVNASTINSSTVELRNTVTNALVATTITYNATTHAVTITPVSALSGSAAYTVKIKGGTAGVKDIAGNAMMTDYTWSFTTAEPPLLAATEGPGGPILVVSSSANPFSRYAVEILRAEGLNEFAATDISTVTAAVLNNYDVVVLGEMTVTTDQVTLLTNWVNAGGTLITFKPSSLLSPLLGITNTTSTLSDKYLLVNTSTDIGAGIVNQTIQYHGMANLYTIPLNGATTLASLYSDAATASGYPAITMKNVGTSGGRAFAFTYDLAKSIIYTRQGNPAWAGQKRDGEIDPIRSDDLFFGQPANTGTDWIDFNKIAIPQADEQQRLLVNIILQSNLHRKPLPRFWYLPRDLKAAIVMTGDDHNNNGTEGRFNQYETLGPNTVQDVADWRAIRGTSYMYPVTPITNEKAMSFEAAGFEIALHPTTGCVDYTMSSLQDDFTLQKGLFTSNYPGLSSSVTSRTHCLAWSDWASQPKVELQNGVRLDATYYYWPQEWMQNRPGMFTGSGMPMRFADLDGSLIDVYQAPTQMTDETNMDYTSFCNAVLDKAIGPEGYYGVFTANMHNDVNPSPGSDAIIASALARQIPVISAKQMLNWLDGRNNSSFGSMTWNNNQLTFTANVRMSARNLKAMLPLYSQSGQLVSITQSGVNVPFTTQTIKGLQYAFFAPATGSNTYVATYGTSLKVAAPVVKDPKTPPTTGTTGAAAVAATAGKTIPVAELYVNIMPNPGISYFNVVISSNDANPVTVTVRDLFGRVLETHQKVTSTGILRIGNNWAAGTYFAEIVQGDQRKVMKLIKVN